MSVTAPNLIRWAGLSAMVAGLCYMAVGLFHPVEILSSVTTPRWMIVHSLATLMAFFGLLGIMGLYARQVKETGRLALAGFVLFVLWFVLIVPFTFAEVFLLPPLATESPKVVESFLGIFTGSAGGMNLDGLATLYTLSGIVYIFAGLLFGIATFRAGVLPRWAAGLLAVGAALSPAGALLPHEYKALVAVPVGFALAWLGYALWTERREYATEALRSGEMPKLRPAGAE